VWEHIFFGVFSFFFVVFFFLRVWESILAGRYALRFGALGRIACLSRRGISLGWVSRWGSQRGASPRGEYRSQQCWSRRLLRGDADCVDGKSVSRRVIPASISMLCGVFGNITCIAG